MSKKVQGNFRLNFTYCFLELREVKDWIHYLLKFDKGRKIIESFNINSAYNEEEVFYTVMSIVDIGRKLILT